MLYGGACIFSHSVFRDRLHLLKFGFVTCCGRKGICTVLDIRVLFLAAGECEGLLGDPMLRLDGAIQDDKA